MGLCDESNKRNTRTAILFFLVAAPVTLYSVAEGGLPTLVSSALTGLVSGAVVAGVYYGYQCDFKLGECLGSGALSAGCGAASDIGALLGMS
jgi:hypothetical protein